MPGKITKSKKTKKVKKTNATRHPKPVLKHPTEASSSPSSAAVASPWRKFQVLIKRPELYQEITQKQFRQDFSREYVVGGIIEPLTYGISQYETNFVEDLYYGALCHGLSDLALVLAAELFYRCVLVLDPDTHKFRVYEDVDNVKACYEVLARAVEYLEKPNSMLRAIELEALIAQFLYIGFHMCMRQVNLSYVDHHISMLERLKELTKDFIDPEALNKQLVLLRAYQSKLKQFETKQPFKVFLTPQEEEALKRKSQVHALERSKARKRVPGLMSHEKRCYNLHVTVYSCLEDDAVKQDKHTIIAENRRNILLSVDLRKQSYETLLIACFRLLREYPSQEARDIGYRLLDAIAVCRIEAAFPKLKYQEKKKYLKGANFTLSLELEKIPKEQWPAPERLMELMDILFCALEEGLQCGVNDVNFNTRLASTFACMTKILKAMEFEESNLPYLVYSLYVMLPKIFERTLVDTEITNALMTFQDVLERKYMEWQSKYMKLLCELHGINFDCTELRIPVVEKCIHIPRHPKHYQYGLLLEHPARFFCTPKPKVHWENQAKCAKHETQFDVVHEQYTQASSAGEIDPVQARSLLQMLAYHYVRITNYTFLLNCFTEFANAYRFREMTPDYQKRGEFFELVRAQRSSFQHNRAGALDSDSRIQFSSPKPKPYEDDFTRGQDHADRLFAKSLSFGS